MYDMFGVCSFLSWGMVQLFIVQLPRFCCSRWSIDSSLCLPRNEGRPCQPRRSERDQLSRSHHVCVHRFIIIIINCKL